MYKHESYERKTEPKLCGSCRQATLEPKQMNIMSDPKVFTFAIHWLQPDDVERDDVKRVFQFITPMVDIKLFMKTESSDDKKTVFIFRGFISYYGKHYMANFYSEKQDCWMHFDDSRITEVGK